MLPLVRIKKMGIGDIRTVSSLINRYFPYANLSPVSIREKLANSSHFFIARVNGDIAGFVELKLKERGAFIVGIATEASLTNKGIGTRLLEHAIEFAHRKGKNKISLVVKSTNISAINLYRRYGFIIKSIKHGIRKSVFLMTRQMNT